jgi:hypothetical protein
MNLLQTAVLLATAASLAQAEIKTFPNKDANWSQYKTYSIVTTRLATKTGIQENDPIVAPLMRAAVAREMDARGFKQQPSNGDISIYCAGISGGTVQLEALMVTWGWDAWWGTYMPMTATAINRFNRDGTLAVGLVDAKTKKGLWSGMTTDGMPTVVDEKNISGIIDKAAGKVFKKFPVKK